MSLSPRLDRVLAPRTLRCRCSATCHCHCTTYLNTTPPLLSCRNYLRCSATCHCHCTTYLNTTPPLLSCRNYLNSRARNELVSSLRAIGRSAPTYSLASRVEVHGRRAGGQEVKNPNPERRWRLAACSCPSSSPPSPSPALLLLLVLAEAGLRLAALALRGDGGGGGRYAWPTRSAFLGYRIARAGAAGGRLSSASAAGGFPQDEAPLPRECCDRLAIALYRRGKGPDQPEAPVDCVFCLSRVDEGEEVRELRCRHVFHRTCLDAWLVRPRATCPLCRDRLLPSGPPRACTLDDDDDDDDDAHDDLSSTSSASYPHGGALWHM